MICGVLTWLKLFEENRIEELKAKVNEKEENEEEDDDWISAFSKKREFDEEKLKLKQELQFLLDKIEMIKDLKKSRQKIQIKEFNKVDADFDELFKDAKDVQDAVKRELNALDHGFDPEDQEDILDDYLSDDEETESGSEEEKLDFSLRIFYCSRTHSQLSQFVHEVQKTKFSEDIRLISLASRANMCINDSVLALKNPSLINERCLELQKKKSKKTPLEPVAKKSKKSSSGSCQFYKSSLIGQLRDQSLLQVQDIEQLVTKGRQIGACPYYASRKAIENAQVVVIPYNTLLHSVTREAIGINLENSVIIIDEAHNVLETISHIHSAEISKNHTEHAQEQLKAYFKRFQGMLKAKNLLYIKQLMFVLAKLASCFHGSESKMMLHSDFLAEIDIFHLNLFKLIKYVEKSRICHKLQSYNAKKKKENNGEKPKKGLSAFLNSITNKVISLLTIFDNFFSKMNHIFLGGKAERSRKN